MGADSSTADILRWHIQSGILFLSLLSQTRDQFFPPPLCRHLTLPPSYQKATFPVGRGCSLTSVCFQLNHQPLEPAESGSQDNAKWARRRVRGPRQTLTFTNRRMRTTACECVWLIHSHTLTCPQDEMLNARQTFVVWMLGMDVWWKTPHYGYSIWEWQKHGVMKKYSVQKYNIIRFAYICNFTTANVTHPV